MKKLFHFLFSRVFAVSFLILLQLLIIVLAIWNLSANYVYYYAINVLLSLIIVIWLINKNSNPSVKLPWVIIILLVPVFGGVFYLLFGSANVSFFIKRKLNCLIKETNYFLPKNQQIIDEIAQTDPQTATQAQYLQNIAAMPIYKNTETTYLTPGENMFACLLEELKQAKHFIFMEYFIVQEGKMWDSILAVLAEKAKAGLDVRMMYDDMGCVNTLPKHYNKKLEKMGIKSVAFNPFRPSLSVSLHNRDHRKITIIDGHTGFTGGINLADEYINEYEKHGHWKDASIRLKGEAVWNLTILFLQSWNFYRPTDEDYSKFRYRPETAPSIQSDGYVQPYGDSPFDDELVSETVYINFIYRATKYIYINTPYLIVDNELVTALISASKRGVDVRICTPHIPDKWYVHMITQAYYPMLLKAGIKIYEYTPGFLHSKTFVADDQQAIVGTINLDYRSLYHHFECAVFLYQSSTIQDIKADYLHTLESCTEITEEFCRKIPWYKRIIRGLIRLFSPLM